MRILGKVSYKGTAYSGWAKQVKEPSVQETIENALSRLFNQAITIQGSGRTDKGVHASGQTFHFDAEVLKMPLSQLKYAMNCLLPKDIHILSFHHVSASFHARYSAKKKIYTYVMECGENNPFTNELSFNCLYPFDHALFKQALSLFAGEHSFMNFTSKETDEQNFIRNIDSVEIKEKSQRIKIIFTGNGFMRYMIRYIIGYSLAVAVGKESLASVSTLLNQKERRIVSYKAPAEGLYLTKVIY